MVDNSIWQCTNLPEPDNEVTHYYGSPFDPELGLEGNRIVDFGMGSDTTTIEDSAKTYGIELLHERLCCQPSRRLGQVIEDDAGSREQGGIFLTGDPGSISIYGNEENVNNIPEDDLNESMSMSGFQVPDTQLTVGQAIDPSLLLAPLKVTRKRKFKYICESCQEPFSNKRHHGTHAKKEHEARVYLCDCGASLSRDDALIYHRNTRRHRRYLAEL
ncbi:hypothetical protein H072_6594 [Dactylellina haptotyla CBS 200.50]|uniref:C2H2-type domain-containing protein n=1 Tax=Dactylellina haptotyla (strain CBS 200.50) TaxID=1284197 RepID=S8BWF7_DACHA|nr:hypothetical protein H072_6594 [Dactylellina haptotyla CBS 200.50]